ncbi:hypothetical protein CC86DRAFT_407688 [Ophiobolus disseminans]|uniref:Uncharacterized protein n=1 Tax=Ophiobolus disseminans TaxID=1469910 RepID=A0A6A6ZY66_9PLEO|nr:hypothetical protein CC86DRAFT_407688 [Ophiobolus disseminans]
MVFDNEQNNLDTLGRFAAQLAGREHNIRAVVRLFKYTCVHVIDGPDVPNARIDIVAFVQHLKYQHPPSASLQLSFDGEESDDDDDDEEVSTSSRSTILNGLESWLNAKESVIDRSHTYTSRELTCPSRVRDTAEYVLDMYTHLAAFEDLVDLGAEVQRSVDAIDAGLEITVLFARATFSEYVGAHGKEESREAVTKRLRELAASWHALSPVEVLAPEYTPHRRDLPLRLRGKFHPSDMRHWGAEFVAALERLHQTGADTDAARLAITCAVLGREGRFKHVVPEDVDGAVRVVVEEFERIDEAARKKAKGYTSPLKRNRRDDDSKTPRKKGKAGGR